jgi:energy-coupling factor transporter ATP-binding protein EcfA2
MEFRDWFCLKNRDSFNIDPKLNPEDARFYFGRQEIMKRVKGLLRRSFIDPKAPKMVVFGPYGCGKTQLLYHLEHILTNEPPETIKLKPHIVHLDIEMKSKSDHKDWHLQMMEALSMGTVKEWVESISKKFGNVEEELRSIFEDPNVAEAIRKLLIGGVEYTAWRWLCGHELPAKDLEQLRVTRNLGRIGAGDMARALISIGSLAEKNGEKLIYMIDEAERFTAVRTGDETQYLIDYLREISDKSNSTVGFVIAGTAQALEDLPELFLSGAVRRAGRIGPDHYIDIPFLPAVDDVKIFLRELFGELVEQTKAEERIRAESLEASLETYPFNSESFDILCQYATEDPTKALPSHLIHCVNECAISAWDEKKSIIDTTIVNDIAPLVFG